MTPVYRRVILNVRPPRLATVFYGGEQWEVTARRLLEGYTRIWGGGGNLIVPIGETGQVHPALWRVLKRYDADRWAFYAVTRHGQRMAQPYEYEAVLAEQASTWAKEHGGTIEAARELLTSDDIMRAPLNRPPEVLADRIRREMGAHASHADPLFSVGFVADAHPGPDVGAARLLSSPSRCRRSPTTYPAARGGANW
jgi:hypothetical protein